MSSFPKADISNQEFINFDLLGHPLHLMDHLFQVMMGNFPLDHLVVNAFPKSPKQPLALLDKVGALCHQ